LLTNQKLKKETRSSLYFNEYKHCLKFYLPNVYALRYRSHWKIDQILEYNAKRNFNWGGSWRSLEDEFSRDSEELHELLYLIEDIAESCKLTVQRHHGYLYTNDCSVIETVSDLEYISNIQCKSVELTAAGTMKLKNPQHDYRTYFKSQRIQQEDKTRLAQFINAQTAIRPGPGFKDFLDSWTNYCYVQQNHFLDHNDMGVLTMLQLVCPIKIKKTLELISDK
jgi:hypothetical protein